MKTRIIALLLLPLLLAAGCGRTIDPHAAWREVATQISTYPALAAGHYDGVIAVSNLLAYGDHGLGTFDGLDGELVLHTGVVFRVAADGTASRVTPEVTVPFAQVTWFAADTIYSVTDLNQKLFHNMMRWKQPDAGQVRALRVTGRFKSLHVRSVARQEKPYPTLETVVAERQVEHRLRDIDGTLVGFHMPAVAGTIAPPAFHLHFISADGTRGGHVFDFDLAYGLIEIDDTPELRVLLPVLGE
ncbi:MAG TPA: acetolactate decarboxylase [Kiritimatiellia bacterium]|nr:acetolactate decarboxylase [Kiritimatiellia bacterium]